MRLFTRQKLALALSMTGLAAASHVYAQEPQLEEVEVVGFRATLEQAMDAKRESTTVSDSIMAEDIGKFPDLNLAESLQRVPGVTISREGGEGRQITLRGLPPSFTRTSLNGMEVPASGDGLDSAGGVNLGRGFDFNIFASELFSRIDVQKSSAASTEEGGIAGSVDLDAPRPFDKPGFNAAVSAKGAFNTTYDTQDPRLAGLVSNTFADDKFGVLASIAYTERTVRQEGFGSVRFSFPNNNGDEWADLSQVQDTGFTDEELNDGTVWFPRLPRTDYFGNNQTRLGSTLSLQARPTERVELTLNFMNATLENERDSYNLFAQFRSQWENLTPTSLTINDNNVATAGTFDGVVTRSESRRDSSKTDFSQITFDVEYQITDNLVMDALIGTAESEFVRDYYRINLNSPAATFSYDFGNSNNVASLDHGYDLNDLSLHTVTNPDARRWTNNRANDTARVDFTYDLSDTMQIKTGLITNTREVVSARFRSTGSSFNVQGSDVSAETISEVLPVSDFGTGFNAPNPFPTSWAVINFDKAIDTFGIGDLAFEATRGETFDVTESTTGAYIEANSTFELAGKELRTNAGARWVETETEVAALVGTENVTVSRTYNDLLPSINLTYGLSEDVQMRFSYGESMTRPSLSSLRINNSYGLTTGTVSGGNSNLDPVRSTNIDIGLEWYFAEESAVGFTYFTKDIEGLIVSDTFTGMVDPAIAAVLVTENFDSGRDIDPRTDEYEFSVPVNAGTSEFSGFELFYQQPFTFLPGALSNLGMIANYTKVEADTELNGETVDFEGLSENMYNGTLYYETERYGMRLSVANRDDYITDVTGSNGNVAHGTTGTTQYDMSAFYNINDNITATFEGVNLTDEYERLFTTGSGNQDLVRQYTHTGTIYFVGVRANF